MTTLEEKKHLFGNIILALGLGLMWGALTLDAMTFIGYQVLNQAMPEIKALAAGDRLGYLLFALAQEIAAFALPSLLIGYLILRVYWTRHMAYALLAGMPMFMPQAANYIYSLIANDVVGMRGVHGVHGALNLALILVAIPASVAILSRVMGSSSGLAPNAA